MPQCDCCFFKNVIKLLVLNFLSYFVLAEALQDEGHVIMLCTEAAVGYVLCYQ